MVDDTQRATYRQDKGLDEPGRYRTGPPVHWYRTLGQKSCVHAVQRWVKK